MQMLYEQIVTLLRSIGHNHIGNYVYNNIHIILVSVAHWQLTQIPVRP